MTWTAENRLLTVDEVTATIERRSVTPISAVTPPRTTGIRRLYASSNGKKAVMAVTGATLVLFLVGHMLGNLKIFLGAGSFNHYAAWLRSAGEPVLPGRVMLTITEAVLTLAVILHMWAAVSLARRAARARPVKYAAKRKSRASGYATHTMRYGGIVILLFVVWHLLDLTFGVVNPKGHDATPYDRVVAGFDPSRWWVTAFYLVAMAMVTLHLRHGLWSAFQTLGLASKRRNGVLKASAAALSLILFIGFVSVPVAVMIGAVK